MISAWFERFCSQWSVYSKSDQTCLFFQMSTICFRCWAFLWSPIRRDEGKACGSFSIFCGSSLILRSRVQAQPQYEKRGIWTWFNYKITRDCINFFPRTKETILSGDCGQGTSPGTITFFSCYLTSFCSCLMLFLLRWGPTTTWGLTWKELFLLTATTLCVLLSWAPPCLEFHVWVSLTRTTLPQHSNDLVCLWFDCSVDGHHRLISLPIFYLGQILNTVTEEPMTSWSHKYYVLCFPITVYCFT